MEEIFKEMSKAKVRQVLNLVIKEATPVVGLLSSKELRQIAYKEYLPRIVEKHARIR